VNNYQKETMEKFIEVFKNTHILNEEYVVKKLKTKVGKDYVSLLISVGKENGFDKTSTILIDKSGQVTGYNNQLQTIYGIEANLYQ
jgi:hypothetical protein